MLNLLDTICYHLIYNHFLLFFVNFIFLFLKLTNQWWIGRSNILMYLSIKILNNLISTFYQLAWIINIILNLRFLSTFHFFSTNNIISLLLSKPHINPKIVNGSKFVGVVLDESKPLLCCHSLFRRQIDFLM